MKTLKEHTILYDGNCPMCNLYTGAFVKTGMLDRLGRAAYQDLHPAACPTVDRDRAVNEIALVNRQTGEVTYGVQSLFKILGNSWPLLRPLFRLRAFAAAAGMAYSFISFNRRVIVPSAHDVRDRPPRFHAGWRAAWIVFAWLLTAFILTGYSHRLEGLLPASNGYRELAICGGQVLWQGALVLLLARRKVADYLGNMMTISLAGGLMLAFFGLIFDLAGITAPVVAAIGFMGIAGLMLLEHLRRCRMLGLPWTLSASWVLYRLLLLYFILN